MDLKNLRIYGDVCVQYYWTVYCSAVRAHFSPILILSYVQSTENYAQSKEYRVNEDEFCF